ncbi:hypothetical protein QC761_0097800 [Podospora bellae-mahoneyi]|uniref:Uncharacterized protein n=1 Tax=Podospora bellae-mahoneyi TaxID=2093777 RepID=A0ABR0FAK7_9PEZI|nr:hypothetical protein QC761_0097800 [Podospora bellae-mahoneyi]
MPVTHNLQNFQGHLDFIHDLLPRFSFSVKPAHYDPVFSFKYKSFVYLISLASALESDYYLHGENGPLQPGCVAIPKGTKELILRLTNLEAEGMSRTGRVENEVAMTKLASSAHSSY